MNSENTTSGSWINVGLKPHEEALLVCGLTDAEVAEYRSLQQTVNHASIGFVNALSARKCTQDAAERQELLAIAERCSRVIDWTINRKARLDRKAGF